MIFWNFAEIGRATDSSSTSTSPLLDDNRSPLLTENHLYLTIHCHSQRSVVHSVTEIASNKCTACATVEIQSSSVMPIRDENAWGPYSRYYNTNIDPKLIVAPNLISHLISQLSYGSFVGKLLGFFLCPIQVSCTAGFLWPPWRSSCNRTNGNA